MIYLVRDYEHSDALLEDDVRPCVRKRAWTADGELDGVQREPSRRRVAVEVTPPPRLGFPCWNC